MEPESTPHHRRDVKGWSRLYTRTPATHPIAIIARSQSKNRSSLGGAGPKTTTSTATAHPLHTAARTHSHRSTTPSLLAPPYVNRIRPITGGGLALGMAPPGCPPSP